MLIGGLGAVSVTTRDAFAQTLDGLPVIEFNSTAGDLGFHVELCASPWKQMAIIDPLGNQIFHVQNLDSLETQGLTGLTFESAEPPLEELPLEEFLARFPEGEYMFVGETIEGEVITSIAEFLHNIPDAPVITTPMAGASVDREHVRIAWMPVTGPEDIEIDVYQLQIFPVDPPEGQEPIALNIDLLFEVPSTITEVKIPQEFLMLGEEYQYEVVAVETGGNRTFTVGTFKTQTNENNGSSDNNDGDDDDDDDDDDD